MSYMMKTILILPGVVTLHQVLCVMLDCCYGNSLLLLRNDMMRQRGVKEKGKMKTVMKIWRKMKKMMKKSPQHGVIVTALHGVATV
jgi:hypothetical protein